MLLAGPKLLYVLLTYGLPNTVQFVPYLQPLSWILTSVFTLLFASLTGMPVSTGHCNTSAIMGVGASRSIKRVNWSIAKNMLLAWVITFPACGLIGFVLAKLFMMLA